MKKILLSLIIFITVSTTYAQITINSLPLYIGDSVFQATDTLFDMNLSTIGGNQTWDFSGLQQHTLDTIVPIRPDSTNHKDDFKNSNLAFGTKELAAYVQNNTNEYVSLGFGGYVAAINADILMVYSDPDSIIDFPMNYGDSRNIDAYGSNYSNVQGQDVRFSESVFRKQTIDAWGKITTPSGTFDVIRVNEYLIKIDSVFAVSGNLEIYQEQYSSFDTSYNYIFYTNLSSNSFNKYPILSVKYDHDADTIINTKWVVKSIDNPDTDGNYHSFVNTIKSSNIKIFPNPTKNIINISTSEIIENVNIIDIRGSIVLSSNKKHINISSLPKGLYFMKIKTDKENFTQKLLIQ